MTDLPLCRVVYAGKILADPKGKSMAICFVLEGQEKARCTVFKDRGLGYWPRIIGGIYEAEADVDGDSIKSIRFGGKFKFTGQRIADTNLAREWEAAQEADAAELRGRQSAALMASNTPLMRNVDEIRRCYQRLAPSQRMGFRIWLLNQLDGRA